MDIPFHDWLNLLLRWIHLIAGISWIGSSFYFMWLDSHLDVPEKPDPNVEGALWMVHSGGFYQVERRRIGPGQMPKTLHWFKWEATFTWISGFFLLGVVYYFTGGAYLVDPNVSPVTPTQATALGLGLLVVSWFGYDALFQSRLGKSNLATVVASALLIAVAYGMCQILSGRAAYIHVGAMFGTLMVLNVWVRILPAQQQMIDATARGEKPDFALSGHAKRRSVHNTYMTFPVLFIMLSNHYPMTYGHRHNWVVLLLLTVFGAATRHVMVTKHGAGRWALVPAATALVAVVAMTSTPKVAAGLATGTEKVNFKDVREIFHRRCLSCHATRPTDASFGPTPAGVTFDEDVRIKALADRIKVRVVDTKTMPLMNKTQMTEEERQAVARWISQGASLD